MNYTLQTIITSAASVLALSALAQVTPAPNSGGPDNPGGRMAHMQPLARLNDAAKASDLIGMTVKNYQNEKLGKVEDLAVDVESGRVVQVILSTGGFIGIGDTLTALPPGAFHRDITNKVLHLNADKEKIKNAPKFEMSKWADYCDSNHLAQVYSYYGQEPTLGFVEYGDTALDNQRTTDSSPSTVSTRKTDGTWNKDRVSSDSQSQWMIPASRLGQVQQASKLMGTPVNNLQNEKLGKVENLLVDLPSGRVVAIIVSSGGFLGMGDELSAVPPTALRFNTERDTLQLDASKEMLSNAPHFKANQWPDFAQPSYASGVYHAYKVEPYFTSNPATEPDNTARNVRDRDNNTLTPLDQGNSKADVTQADNAARNVRDRNNATLTPLDQGHSQSDRDITAQIRKEIVAGKDLSMNAHNVKIITVDGRVTLRGPVNTEEEKRLIGEIADRIARSGNVDNQLEVKLTPTGRN